jgi:hypothetical protein
MAEVIRSTEHRLEIENITIKIDAPDATTINIYAKKPTYSSMCIKIEDMPTLRVALQEFQNWVNGQAPKQEAKNGR